jgi:16S rRNA (guanine527-N7)-methyltransferase
VICGDRDRVLRLIEANGDLTRRLDTYVDLLARWRTITNLVSEATFARVWSRHIADSAQLLKFASTAQRWVDIGSGAGFPGMVIALQLAESTGARVHLIESDRRKCAFLREVVRATSAPILIHAVRIQSLDANMLGFVDAVTARAFAPFPRLIEVANLWLSRGATGVFPCGCTAERQIDRFAHGPNFYIETFPSRLDAQARIVRVRGKPEAST